MKIKKLSFFLVAVTAFVLLLAATSLTVSAAEVTYPVEGGNIKLDTTTGLIIRCDKTVTHADIPEYINGIKVVGINHLAFYECRSLKSVIIPASVDYVDSQAFKYCSSLEKVAFMGDKVYWEVMGPVFEDCKVIKTIVLPNMAFLGEDKHFPTASPALYNSLKYVYYRGSKAEFDEAFPNYRSFIENNGGKIYYNYSCTGPFGHEYEVDRETTITCTEFTGDRCCIYCNEPQDQTEYVIHNWGEWTTTITPTCSQMGEEIRSCTDCNSSQLRTPFADHTWGEWATIIAPTCKETGTAVRACIYCDASESCSVNKTDHPWDEWKIGKDPTCGKAGYRYHYCSECYKYQSEEIPSTGNHTFGEWRITVTPNCIKEGRRVSSCSGCDAYKAESIPATGEHSWSAWGVSVAPTFESEGKEVRLCTVCNATESRTVPAVCVTASVDGLNITVHNLDGVRDYFIAKGSYDTYRDTKNNSVMRVTAARINGADEYVCTVSEPGEYSICVRFNDGSENLMLYATVSASLPEFKAEGLALTVSGLEGIRVIRTAPGVWNTPGEVKRAEGARNVAARNITGDEFVLTYTESGTYTVTLEYSNGLIVVEHIELTGSEPTMVREGNSVTFGNLDGLYTLRYAKGEYATMGEIKRAEGCRYRRSRDIVDGVITVTDLEPGTYTFCVQYNDQSYHYFTVVVE